MQKLQAMQMHHNTQYGAGITDIADVRAIQVHRGEKPCFMTTERLLCKNTQCEWRRDCRKLVAVWKR